LTSQVLFKPHPKQEEFIKACFDPRYKYLLFGGAVRGGKSYVALAVLILLCKLYPGSRWAVIRKTRTVLTSTTILTFNKLVPDGFIEDFNKTDLLATFKNGSQILFTGEQLSTDPDLDRFKGFEVNGFVLEEVNELAENTFYKCMERAGAWVIDSAPKPLIICTCNPSQTWVKNLFYSPWVEGKLKEPYFYLPSKITDNIPLIESQAGIQYLDSIKNLPPEFYERFINGSWEGADEPGQLVPWEELYYARDLCEEVDGVRSMGVDVAGHGVDKTVFYILQGCNIDKIIEFDNTSIPQVTAKIKELMITDAINAENVCVDGAGLGAGVIDELNEASIFPVNFLGGGKVISDDSSYNYKNARAQAYWQLKLAFKEHKIGNVTNTKLLSDLAAIKYTIEAEKQIKIESKDEIKKRLGRSPDHADALAYAWWARIHSKIRTLPGLFVF